MLLEPIFWLPEHVDCTVWQSALLCYSFVTRSNIAIITANSTRVYVGQ